MDALEEKKWFVYMKDHHDGPFTLAEIQGQISGGAVSPANYVWAEGMADWTPMNSVSAFEGLLQPKAQEKTREEPIFALPSLEEPVAESSYEPALLSEPVPQAPAEPNHDEAPAKLPRRSRAGLWLLVVLLFLIGGIPVAYIKGWLDPVLTNPTFRANLDTTTAKIKPVLLQLAQKYPALQKWISPIPPLNDVTPEEYAELQKAAMSIQEAGPGAQATLALSRADLLQPAFYIASSANGERTEYDIYVEGQPDTLLNQTSFFAKTRVVVSQHLGKSESVKTTDGRPLVRGQYKVSLAPPTNEHTEDGMPREVHPLASRTYFLGGANDGMYLTRLKEFHEKLQAKATTEIQELKQLESTLTSQLETTLTQFELIHAGKVTAAKKLKWNDFHAKWQKLADTLALNTARWSAPGVLNEYFHGDLYALTLNAAQALDKLHRTQTEFAQGRANKSIIQIQLGQATSVAQNTVASLKLKVEKAAALPPTAGGLPQKEAPTP